MFKLNDDIDLRVSALIIALLQDSHQFMFTAIL